MENTNEEFEKNILDFSVVQKGCVLYTFGSKEFFLVINKDHNSYQIRKLKLHSNTTVGEEKRYYFQKKQIAGQENHWRVGYVDNIKDFHNHRNYFMAINQKFIDNQVNVCDRELAVIDRMEKAIHEFKQKETQKILAEANTTKKEDSRVSQEPANKMYWFMPGDLVVEFNSGFLQELTGTNHNIFTDITLLRELFDSGFPNHVLNFGFVVQNVLDTNPKHSYFRLLTHEIFMCYKNIDEVWSPETAGCKIQKINMFGNYRNIDQEYNKEPNKSICWMTIDEYFEKRKAIFQREKNKWLQVSELVKKLMKEVAEVELPAPTEKNS